MAAQEHVLSAGDSGRAVGLVYLDGTLAAGPATHVLVIGVASYRSARLRKPLDTATISARAVADWFVDGAKARFNNPDCALGSVAIALSEVPGATKANYAGGEVPRADFASVKAAVRAWVKRINSHKDNLAILYVAAHGESHLDRTAFLLEDYATDDLDDTVGMSEIERFVGSLENAKPVDQLLLFDCCRTPTDMKLPWDTPLGDNLIALTRQTDDHGEPRKQWVIAATSLGEYATGMAAGPTLFNRALIDALNGVASDASEDGWPVRPGALFDKIDRILALHRLPDERPQTPAGRMAGSFNITYPGEPADVPVYVALEDPADWPECSITVTVDGKPGDAIVGRSDPPFHVLRVPELADLRLAAERGAAILGQARVKKVRGPAVFVEIKDAAATANPVVGQLDSGRSVAPMARILIAINSPTRIDAGAVAEVQRRDEAATPPKKIVVTVGGETPLDVRPGEHVVTVRLPDGQSQTREVALAKDEIVKVMFSTQRSPHEWLASAAVAGAIRDRPSPDPVALPPALQDSFGSPLATPRPAAPSWPTSGKPQGARPRVALVIGNGDYRHAPALQNPANDAHDIGATLRAMDFDVIEGIDLSVDEMDARFSDFAKRIDGAQTALFFFAGHGLQVDGENYLMPVDARIDDSARFNRQTINLRDQLRMMSRAARNSVLLLDCNRDNPFTRTPGLGLAPLDAAGEEALIAFAARPGAVAVDGTDRNSPFTSALLQHLPTPGRSLDDIMVEVAASVETDTGGRQIPWSRSSLRQDLVLNPDLWATADPFGPQIEEASRGLESTTAPPRPPHPVGVGQPGYVTVDLAFEAPPSPVSKVPVVADDDRFLRLGIESAGNGGQESRVPFVRIECAGRVEFAVLPGLELLGRSDAWHPYVVVDRAARASEPLASVVVESKIWEGLLGFLGSRDIAAGNQLLDDRLQRNAVEAIADKVGNPFAAVAGALMAVAASSPDFEKRWDPWLRNLAAWFPGLPDGPIILGRRLLMRARNAQDIAAARTQFVEGFRRGAPVFSMSADWMARGFESLPGDDAELLDLRARARRLANRIDRKRPFTVIRVSG